MERMETVFQKCVVLLLSIAIPSILGGCASYDLRRYGPIDTSQKTITVPPGGSALIGGLKQILRNNGWTLSVYRGPTESVGQFSGMGAVVRTSDTFNTRYSLFVAADFYDYEFPTGSRMFHYDISLVDNRSGSEVFTLSGSGVERVILQRFERAL